MLADIKHKLSEQYIVDDSFLDGLTKSFENRNSRHNISNDISKHITTLMEQKKPYNSPFIEILKEINAMLSATVTNRKTIFEKYSRNDIRDFIDFTVGIINGLESVSRYEQRLNLQANHIRNKLGKRRVFRRKSKEKKLAYVEDLRNHQNKVRAILCR